MHTYVKRMPVATKCQVTNMCIHVKGMLVPARCKVTNISIDSRPKWSDIWHVYFDLNG